MEKPENSTSRGFSTCLKHALKIGVSITFLNKDAFLVVLRLRLNQTSYRFLEENYVKTELFFLEYLDTYGFSP